MRIDKKDNSGYTLVELIIVIAIIAVMTGAGAMTIGAIRTSQATASMQSFDDELAALEMRTKSQSADNAILLERDGTDYKIYYGTYDSKASVPSFNKTDPGKADAVLERVTIMYDSTNYDADSSTAVKIEDSQIIQFRKSDGEVIIGAGQYKFLKYGSNQSVGRITLSKYVGSHTYGNND